VCRGSWSVGVGRSNPRCEPWSVAFGSVVPLGLPTRGTCIVLGVGKSIVIAMKVLGPRSSVRHRSPCGGTTKINDLPGF